MGKKARIPNILLAAFALGLGCAGAAVVWYSDAATGDSRNPKDTTAPAAINDLAARQPNIHSVRLTWTAPGDGGASRRAVGYTLRYATSPITPSNWNTAADAGSKMFDRPAGELMRYQVNRLKTGTKYYFAVKTTGAAGNESRLSNVVSATTHVPKPDEVAVSTLTALRRAIDDAPPSGRVITLKPGIYHQTKVIEIKNKNNITIRGATHDFNDTVIAGQGENDQRTMLLNFKVSNSDYITLKNLSIEDSYYHAVQIKSDSDYFRALHIKTWNDGESGFKVAAPAHSERGERYSDYGLIQNCVVGNARGGRRKVVEGVDIVAARGWVVRGNAFENIRKADGGPAYAVFAKGNSIGTVIENNTVKNSFLAFSFGGGGTSQPFFRNNDTDYEHRGGIIRNNLAYNIKDTAVYMNKAHDFKVENNTLINVGQDGAAAIVSRFAPSTGVIRNNLTDASIKKRDGGSATIRNNVTDADTDLFVKPERGNYHLRHNAAVAIDKGYPLPEDVPKDIDGQSRPCGKRWDIGADESSCTRGSGEPSVGR